MKASIYSINGGSQIAYQFGNSRAVKSSGEWFCQTLKDGEWTATANRWIGITRKVERAGRLANPAHLKPLNWGFTGTTV